MKQRHKIMKKALINERFPLWREILLLVNKGNISENLKRDLVEGIGQRAHVPLTVCKPSL